jgi:hypothetical protein
MLSFEMQQLANYLLFEVNNACKYFANVSFDPTYDAANVVKFSKLPDCIYAGPYISPTIITPFSVERLLCKVKSTSPAGNRRFTLLVLAVVLRLTSSVCHILFVL